MASHRPTFQKKQGAARRSSLLHSLVQSRGFPNTPHGRAALLCEAGYKGVIIPGHQRCASILPGSYREIFHYDPGAKRYVGTGTYFPKQDFENHIFRFFDCCYRAGKRVATQQQGLEAAMKTSELLPTPASSSIPRIEEIVDDEDTRVFPIRESGTAYEQARQRAGYGAR